MVQIDEIRQAFVLRLRAALARNNIPERGAGARLAKMIDATPKATSKWLNAESMPRGTHLRIIATQLGVRAEWLEYGVLPVSDQDPQPCEPVGRSSNLREQLTTSPRSQQALEKILDAAQSGQLTEDDILLLESVATKIARPAKNS